MAIMAPIARMILCEHKHRAISGDIILIGRQTVPLTIDQTVEMIRSEGIAVRDVDRSAEWMLDTETRSAKHGAYISDRGFFALFTDAQVSTLDVTDYEGAEIIHDLHQPVPAELHDRFDFIFNGSCLDNIFDPAMAIRNISNITKKEGGRIFDIEIVTPDFNAYVTLSQAWHFDYYAINKYLDCKIYSCAFPAESVFDGPYQLFIADSFRAINYQFPRRVVRKRSAWFSVIIAEKQTGSTNERVPLQMQYRPEDSTFEDAFERFSKSSRPIMEFERDWSSWFFVKKAGARYLGRVNGGQ